MNFYKYSSAETFDIEGINVSIDDNVLDCIDDNDLTAVKGSDTFQGIDRYSDTLLSQSEVASILSFFQFFYENNLYEQCGIPDYAKEDVESLISLLSEAVEENVQIKVIGD